ncbi:T9SS type A sorting domain-containing protein [bacterium]|nr:T9SS type A sorting domain-containing protein [bacterium]
MGQTVEQVDLGVIASGSHKYLFDASALPSGIYFAKVSTPTQAKVKKLLLTK